MNTSKNNGHFASNSTYSGDRQSRPEGGAALETLNGVVERVTYHNEQNGWSVIKVSSFRDPKNLQTVVLHQAKVFAGASMEFRGSWVQHPKHGSQFKAIEAIEKKPATAAALEKYLGSGLIKGVGPVTAQRIVKYFKERTLEVFEDHVEELMEVPGIAEKKLEDIKKSWAEHRAIRDVMIFLQGYGISTLFAVKIFKAYGNESIARVSENPYVLARDIYGIGFFSADRVALNMGFERDGLPRIEAGIKHILAASREAGHCYLLKNQIENDVLGLLELDLENSVKVITVLMELLARDEIKTRSLPQRVSNIESNKDSDKVSGATNPSNDLECFYSNSLYFEETYVAKKMKLMVETPLVGQRQVDTVKVTAWISNYCDKFKIKLSEEQGAAVCGIVQQGVSILTGGPGCGKTTSTKVLVKLLEAMRKRIILAAPTGRAAQRMSEVIGNEAKTLHRLLEWIPDRGRFKKCEEDPLEGDFLILDECSMLDVSLAAAVLKAVDVERMQVLMIGDPDQLPSVGAGQVLNDLLNSNKIPKFQLTQVFRQAQDSLIIQYAHKINKGEIPKILSPIGDPSILKKDSGVDCFFLDCEEATQEQLQFVQRARQVLKRVESGSEYAVTVGDELRGKLAHDENKGGFHLDPFGTEVTTELIDNLPALTNIEKLNKLEGVLKIPEKFMHVDLDRLARSENEIQDLKVLLKQIHPWSTLHHGMTSTETILRLYSKTIPEILGPKAEIQILAPQVRGSLGTLQLNQTVQARMNPPSDLKKEIRVGDRVFREGDRVIQTRNNYDLGVFNGDIGTIQEVDLVDLEVLVHFTGSSLDIAYTKEDLLDLSLAYAITVHKSQGSEFQAIIIPIATQHFKMLFRNLIYTGLTRAKKLAVFVGSRRALALSVQAVDQRERQTGLCEILTSILK